MPERILILGNSAAAIAAVNAIRARGGEQAITMVSNEDCSAYSPVLTTHYLSGEIPESALYFCDAGYYRERDIACRFGVAVVELDAAAQRVSLDDGTRLEYDKLLVATGASAKRLTGLDPEIAGDIHYLRTIEDARRIHEAALGAKRVVMMGAGLVSLQVAGAVARPDLKVTCVVASHQILSQNIDATCAELLREHVERSANIEFLFGASVSAITRTGTGYRVCLDSGVELEADLLVAGKGVSPNFGFVDRAQVDADQGVLVDDYLRTSFENVWAAGDVAQGRNRISGEVELVANWIDACEQGDCAGANMTGRASAFPGSVAENITTLFGVQVAAVGITRSREGDGLRDISHLDESRGVYRRLLLRGEVLVGATLLREVADVGVLRGAIVAGREPWPSAEAVARGRVRYAGLLRTPFGERLM
jgi:nitrite reductase (NADH) large subunit